ncbi:uncharacterized protein LOC144129701 [Amblyomma americanum]
MSHVWAVTFDSAHAVKKMLAAGEIQVKERRCLIIDPANQDVRMKIHWLLPGVPDEDVRAAFVPYGKVTEVKAERWRVQGVTDKGSTTRLVSFSESGSPAGRFAASDYRDTLVNLGALPDVLAVGAYQMNHVWAVTVTTADAAQKLLLAVDVKVKDRPCLLIDPNNRELRLKLHWLLHGVTDEDVRVALSPYGKVLEVTREKCRALGVTEKGSTTRTVGLKLHADVKIDDIPHQLKIAGELTLVVVPGRAPLCLRCKSTGHIRRDCKVPRCENGKELCALAVDEPPAKTTVGRRPSFRPLPNTSAARNTAETPP